MFDPKIIQDLTKQVINSLPSGLKEANQDIEKNIRALMQSTFNRLDLVTREEFDIQTQVLAKTRRLVEQLNERILALEPSLNAKEK